MKKDAAQSQTNMKEEEKSEAAKKAMKADAAELMSQVGMESELLESVKKQLDKAPSETAM